eukprot:8359298-Ditylum_brightwellii.AAC.1
MLVAAHKLLASWENASSQTSRGANDGIEFATEGYEELSDEEDLEEHSKHEEVTLATKSDEIIRTKKGKKVTCWTCGGNYFSNMCPEAQKNEAAKGKKKARGTINVTYTDDGELASITRSYKDALKLKLSQPNRKTSTDHIFHQAHGIINKEWLLLNSQSTVNIVCNKELLTNIQRADSTLEIFNNAGLSTTDMIGDLPGFKTVWYQPDGIANIRSLSDVQKDHMVTYDSAHGNCFMVERKDGSVRKFVQSKRVTARQIQDILGNPSLKTLLDIVDNNRLKNCPITRQDIMAAKEIFGPDTRCLQGKMARKDGKAVRMMITPIPPTILERYKEVTLVGDIMKVNESTL